MTMNQKRNPMATMQVAVTPGSLPTAQGNRRGVLVILSGARPGRTVVITEGQDFIVGRTSEATYAVDDESLSRRHVRFFAIAGRYAVEDLKSTNGTFVDGKRLDGPAFLEPGARIQLGKDTVLRFDLQDDAVIEEQKRLYEATVRDKLTGVYNRHFLDERLASELSYAKRHGTALSVLFVDADHFKKVNDTFGHAGGDAVLIALGKLLLASMRNEDVAARYGGEEFILVLRGISGNSVTHVAERIRADVQALLVLHEGQHIPFTVSIGVATHTAEREFEDAAALLAVADNALYKAKETGRNRVVVG
jgi:two-component system cell cycle response regulator